MSNKLSRNLKIVGMSSADTVKKIGGTAVAEDGGVALKLQPNSWVRVKADRWPSIYDVEALNIRAGFFLK
jgi:hypothetical protein